MNNMLIAGCSFTDPLWQDEVPWSVEFGKTHPTYIVAKAGMGIKGIATEAMYFLKTLPTVNTCIIILPTLWRLDVEVSVDMSDCTAMVDLLDVNSSGVRIKSDAMRKWLLSGGLHYDNTTKYGKLFKQMYKYQDLLVILKEHLRSLEILINYCKNNNIAYYISAISDPKEELEHYDIKHEAFALLDDVEYSSWFRFDGTFINRFLKHDNHPTTSEHVLISEYIIKHII
jgi:hypothetical protein